MLLGMFLADRDVRNYSCEVSGDVGHLTESAVVAGKITYCITERVYFPLFEYGNIVTIMNVLLKRSVDVVFL